MNKEWERAQSSIAARAHRKYLMRVQEKKVHPNLWKFFGFCILVQESMMNTRGLSDLFGAVISSLTYNVPNEQRQAQLMQSMMRFLMGDWTLLDPVQPLIRSYILSQLGTDTGEDRQHYVDCLTDQALALPCSDDQFNLALGTLLCREDVDPMEFTARAMKHFLRQTVNLVMDFEASAGRRFSDDLKSVLTEFFGRWFEGLESMLSGGFQGVQQLQHLVLPLAQRAALQRLPEAAMEIQMGLPMLFNLCNQLYYTYKQQQQMQQ
jgi:hypothetical protein